MPATLVTDKLFDAVPRWSGAIGSGGVADDTTTTIPLSSASNLTNGRAYLFTINRSNSDGTKNTLAEMETVIGELSGSNFINCVRGVEGTASGWDAGIVVEVLFTATHWDKLVEWGEVEHNQNGTHKAITTDTITAQTTNAYLDLNGNGTGGVDVNKLRFAGAGVVLEGIKDEDDMASDSAVHAPSQQSVKAYVDTEISGISIASDGWSASADTWVYASASTFTIAGVDRTAVYTKGTRLKFTQTTEKYAVVLSSSFSTNTTVTIQVNTDYTIANATITSPYYSYQANPQGYPGWFAIAPTWAGFITPPSGTSCRVNIIGKAAHLELFAGVGTSDATTFSVTVPFAVASYYNGDFVGNVKIGVNAGTNVLTYLTVDTITATTTKLDLYTSLALGGWTSSGNKGVWLQETFEMA